MTPTDRALLDALAVWMRLTLPDRKGFFKPGTIMFATSPEFHSIHEALDAYEAERKEPK